MKSVTFKTYSDTPEASAYAWVCLMARLCLAAVFLYSGSNKLMHWQDAISEFDGLGLPLPAVGVTLTVVVQCLGGVAVAFGWRVRLSALVLAAFTVIATLIGHPFWNFEGPELQHQLTTMLEHLAIVGGFLLLAANGPGHLSAGRGE